MLSTSSFVAALALAPQQPPADISAFFARHCVECHDADVSKGDLDLTAAPADAVAALARWSRVRDRVVAGEMPPADAPRPTVAELRSLARWVDGTLRHEVPKLPFDPGRVTVRRLTRRQWQNSVHDLLGVHHEATGFVADDLGYGFDTVGEALSLSTLHFEKFFAAAGEVAAAAIEEDEPGQPRERNHEAEQMTVVRGDDGILRSDDARFLSNGTIEQRVVLPRDGSYRLTIVAGADQAGGEAAKMVISIDDRPLRTFDVATRKLRPFEFVAELAGGTRRLGIAFANDFYAPKDPDPANRDRNLYVDRAVITGPTDERPVPAQAQWLAAALSSPGTDEQVLRELVVAALPRAWRRPPSAAEVERLLRLATNACERGDSRRQAARLVLQAALASPNFLFRIEAGAIEAGAAQTDGGAVPVVPLAGHVLAQRLAYFLWASTPDAALRDLADRGLLQGRDALLAAADRMLDDPRADSLATDFATQWLEVRSLADRSPDPQRFRDFDPALRAAMQRETELLFALVLRERRDVRELIDCDFTHVNGRLAAFYGLPAPADPAQFARIVLPDTHRERGGVLGHASVLTVTSNPTRTSPVKRGKWILENLLGQAPPPPPPGSDSFADEAAIDSSASFREQLAQHRSKKSCAACHVRMDTLGFSLEHYDAIGRRHERDAGGVIDASGRLPDGRVVNGLADLKQVLRDDPAFVRNLLTKLFVYALGREPRPVDKLRLELASDQLVRGGKVTLRDLVRVIVSDAAFTHRQVVGR